MALVERLIARPARDLDLIGVPTGGRAVDLLIGAGCVRSLESSGVDLGEGGFAPHFSHAVETGAIEMRDSSCPIMLMALQAAASGVSFTAVPGVLGSDLVARRPDWKVGEDPFRPGCEVLLVPALAPEIAVVQALRCDAEGNLVIPIEFDDRLLIQASGTVIAAVPGPPQPITALAPGEQLVPGAYVDAIALLPA
jgi:glutaconate CoA-transferase, subunit A